MSNMADITKADLDALGPDITKADLDALDIEIDFKGLLE